MFKLSKISVILFLLLSLSAVALAAGNIYEAVNDNGEEVLVYPNPVLGSEFNIKADAEINEVSVVNVLGQKVYSQKNIQSNRVNIELDNSDRGIYIVQVKISGGAVITKRILFK